MVPPSQLEFVPSRVEAEIGTVLELPLAMYGYANKKCKSSKLKADPKRNVMLEQLCNKLRCLGCLTLFYI